MIPATLLLATTITKEGDKFQIQVRTEVAREYWEKVTQGRAIVKIVPPRPYLNRPEYVLKYFVDKNPFLETFVSELGLELSK